MPDRLDDAMLQAPLLNKRRGRRVCTLLGPPTLPHTRSFLLSRKVVRKSHAQRKQCKTSAQGVQRTIQKHKQHKSRHPQR